MVLTDYIYWHYAVASAGILSLLKNYLIGTWHKFLIATHFKTLLAPWHRAKPSEFGLKETLGDKILNTIVDFYIRVIAAIIRLAVILLGLFAELIVIIAFIVLLAIWLLWPVIFVLLISKGLALI